MLGRGALNSTDSQATLALASQIEKEDLIYSLLTVLKVFLC